jgi:Skp family chaperone for outer membrane proteins
MNNRKTTWTFILAAVLSAALCSGFIFKDWGKKTEDQTEAVAKQNEKLVAQDEKITELNGKIDEQNRLLAAQEKRLAELDGSITKKIDQIQANLIARTVDINESDMSMIRETIEKQVQLNVKKGDMPKMGVVSVDKVFRNCKKSATYRQESIAELQRTNAELEKLDNEIKAQTAGLKTLKIGSESYMAQYRELLEKQASLRAQEEFNKQQRGLSEKRITEEIYGDILRITSEIAKEKGLDLVFERSEPELPALSPAELDLSMTTHKLLYDNCCVDITGEVIARLDSQN